MQIKEESIKEKVYQAERNLGVIRLAIIVFNSIIYLLFMQNRPDVVPVLAWLTIVIAIPYGLTVILFQPYRRFPLMATSYFTSIGDALLITIWLAGTGGFDSPFYPVWYASIAAIAFRFDVKETLLAASLYSLAYLGLLIFVEPVRPSLEAIISPIAYIYFVGGIGALLAREFSRQISAKLQAEERYSGLFQNAVVGVYRSDVVGNFLSVNAALTRLFGYESPDEMQAKAKAGDFYIDPKRREAFRAEMEAKGRIANFESEIKRVDGKSLWISESARAVRNDSGDIVAYEGMIEDISVRREGEKMVQMHNRALIQANKELATARRKAEEAARVKDEFLANMSHELRTPLNAIIGYSEIIATGIAGALTDLQRDNMTRILANAESLLSLINDVLDLAKIESGRIELIKEAFDLRDWVSAIYLQVEGLAATKDIQFTRHIEADMPEMLLADQERLRQIVVNLLSNAIKFTDEGEVSLTVQKQGEDQWVMRVCDSGIGIPADAIEYIFDEFRQVDGSSRRKHGGTGLGLAIVRELVTVMGGTIKVESEVGRGSTFTVTLPMVVVETDTPQAVIGN